LPGPIRDQVGRTLGQHAGLPAFTIGQRRGLNIAAPQPLYVTGIDQARNTLVVGPIHALLRDECTISNVHYISGARPTGAFEAEAQARYSAPPTTVIVEPWSGSRARVRFRSPQRAITPGQFLVLYDDKVVLGGGTIDPSVAT
jgi:tRNA-specific 2-thiouridylase